jgi:hypothetical protein
MNGLLTALASALNLSDERLQKFLVGDPSDPILYDLELFSKPPEHLSDEEEAELEHYEFSMKTCRDLLVWRAVCLAHFIGDQIIEYLQTHRWEEDRWLRWREGRGAKAISEFTSQLSDQDFQLLLTCEAVQGMLVLPSRRFDDPWLTLPSDGDLTPVAGALHVEHTPDSSEWLELLGNAPESIQPGNLLRAAWLAAERSSQHQRVDRLRETHTITSEAAQQLESILSFQEPMRALLEQIAKNTGRLNRFRAEEMLKATLGSCYDGLCSEAKIAVMAAEIDFNDLGYPSPDSIVFNLAKAFEIQLRQVVLGALTQHLAATGVQDFPPNTKVRGRIVSEGKLVKHLRLKLIEDVLGSEVGDLGQFCQEYGFDLPGIKQTIAQVRSVRNPSGHDEKLTPAEAARIRDAWLGVSLKDGGIFRFVVTAQFDPRGS